MAWRQANKIPPTTGALGETANRIASFFGLSLPPRRLEKRRPMCQVPGVEFITNPRIVLANQPFPAASTCGKTMLSLGKTLLRRKSLIDQQNYGCLSPGTSMEFERLSRWTKLVGPADGQPGGRERGQVWLVVRDRGRVLWPDGLRGIANAVGLGRPGGFALAEVQLRSALHVVVVAGWVRSPPRSLEAQHSARYCRAESSACVSPAPPPPPFWKGVYHQG